jgi:hypothetical protein
MIFRGLLQDDQKKFETTLRTILDSDKTSRQQFSRLMAEDKALFQHEEKLSQAQSGILTPGDAATPANTCKNVPLDAVLIFLGENGNVAWFTGQTHVVIGSNSHGPVLSIERNPSNSIAVIFDLRTPDGKIIARMDSSGYVVNRNNTLEIKKDDHELEVIDLFGQEVLDVKYLNRRALSIQGRHLNLPMLPMFTRSCFGGNGTDIQVP